MKKRIAIITALILSGCASSSKVTTPSGNQGYFVECNGLAVSMRYCYEKAAKLCPNGYELIDKDAKSWNGVKKGIFIECKSAN